MRGQVTQIQKDSLHRFFILVAFYSLHQSCSNYDRIPVNFLAWNYLLLAP